MRATQDFRTTEPSGVEARLEQARANQYLGEKEEAELRGRELSPEREIAFRELMALMTQKLRPRELVTA